MLQIQKKAFSSTDAVIASFHSPKYRKPMHIHQLAEVIYVLEGEITVTYNGKNETARAGDIAVIHPFLPHRYYTEDGKSVKLWMLLFSSSIINELGKEGEFFYRYERAVFTPSEALSTFIESKMFDTQEEIMYPKPRDVSRIKAIMYPIIDEFTARVRAVAEYEIGAYPISEALVYLSEHFKENLRLDDVARSIGYSKSHISHSLSAMLGMNFRECLNMFRAEHAKKLVLYTNKSMYVVSMESGFTSERSFHRAFIKAVGATPLEYRKLRKNKSSPS